MGHIKKMSISTSFCTCIIISGTDWIRKSSIKYILNGVIINVADHKDVTLNDGEHEKRRFISWGYFSIALSNFYGE
jgi:hypothetical protein